jgi:hypothetical protein
MYIIPSIPHGARCCGRNAPAAFEVPTRTRRTCCLNARNRRERAQRSARAHAAAADLRDVAAPTLMARIITPDSPVANERPTNFL